MKEAHRNGQPVQWLPLAHLAHVVMTLFVFSAPFMVQFLIRKQHAVLESQGINIQQLLLLMGIGGSAFGVSIALVLIGFGGTTEYLRGWAGASFVVATFWCWQSRQNLR
jgi:hypothetical protein